ncbi:MAG TPA: ribosome biogenesis GTPase Der, partial [Patescibacteria group bacterium]
MELPQLQNVAIVGRTNVGKSTLFNRLTEEQKAIVSKVPGTTRDPNIGFCLWRGYYFNLIDTGGLDVSKKEKIEKNIIEQAELAIKKADLILLLIDIRAGLLIQDKDLIRKMKQSKKPFLLVANKADGPKLRKKVEQTNFLGVKNVWPASAVTGAGTGDLLDEVVSQLSRLPSFKKVTQVIPEILFKIAIIGKPNVGKSSILNAILGKEKVIVSEIPHTTRETNDTLISYKNKLILLIDTAGIRKKAKISDKLEKESVARSLRAMKSADLTLFV